MTYNEEFKEAISLAKWLRETLNIENVLNFDHIQSLITALNGRIKMEFLFNHSGQINKVEHGFEITISEFEPETRKLFTLAHELGHLFLHMRYIIDEEYWDTIDYNHVINRNDYNKYDQMEKEANAFAAELLMSEEEFRMVIDKISKNNKVDLNKIAEHFNVSVPAAEMRGKFLNIFRWS